MPLPADTPPAELRSVLPPTRQDILDLENDSLKIHTQNGDKSKRWEKRYRTELSTAVACIVSIYGSVRLLDSHQRRSTKVDIVSTRCREE